MPDLETFAKSANALTIRPGDTLVIAYGVPMDQAAYDEATLFFREHLPDLKVVFLDQVAALAVYRPDEQ